MAVADQLWIRVSAGYHTVRVTTTFDSPPNWHWPDPTIVQTDASQVVPPPQPLTYDFNGYQVSISDLSVLLPSGANPNPIGPGASVPIGGQFAEGETSITGTEATSTPGGAPTSLHQVQQIDWYILD